MTEAVHRRLLLKDCSLIHIKVLVDQLASPRTARDYALRFDLLAFFRLHLFREAFWSTILLAASLDDLS